MYTFMYGTVHDIHTAQKKNQPSKMINYETPLDGSFIRKTGFNESNERNERKKISKWYNLKNVLYVIFHNSFSS